MMDALKCRNLTGKAIFSHTIGGLVAGVSASTDMGDVQDVVPGVDIIGMGPLGLASVAKAHAEDECVSVADLLGLAKQLVYYFCFED